MQLSLLGNLRRLLAYREVMWALLVRDVKVRYKQTALGTLWAVLQPVSMAVVFDLISSSFATSDQLALPYFIFVYAAVLPWNLFATSLGVGGTSVAGHSSLLTKVDFPREVIPIATVLANVLDYTVGLGILLLLLPFFHVEFHLSLLILPLVLLLELIFAVGMVLLLSGINVFYRDVRYLVPLLTLLWLFMTPVFYPISKLSTIAHHLVAWNPMCWVVEMHRAALTGQLEASAAPALWTFGFAVIFFVVAYSLFKRWEPGFADVI